MAALANKTSQQQEVLLENLTEMKQTPRNPALTVGRMFLRGVRDGEKWRRDLIQAIHENRGFADGRDRTRDKDEVAHIQTLVLSSLRFRDMSHRERRIPQAHHRTFEWIYGGRSADASSTHVSSFRDFLTRSDQPVYWISGKPGSGKSTLMKYLRENEATRRHLKTWAGSNECIFASFYFWNSGTDMQMTIEGLLRTLLFECLMHVPSAIPWVLEERYEAYELMGSDDSPWLLPELMEAFSGLILKVSSSKKFFLMIDGLDECAGDQLQLIELILRTQSLTSNLKVCVASRPWTNFEDAFAGRPQLKLQDLTRRDIDHFINVKFNESEGFRELKQREPEYARQLLRDLSRKAQGVFLWVHLVTNSLLSGLANGDGILDLQRRLNALPDNLNDLFKKMLYGLDSTYFGHASRLFQLVRYSAIQPSIFSLALADQEGRSDALRAQVKPFTREQKLLLCSNMRRKLMSRCRGLLEADLLPPLQDGDEDFYGEDSAESDASCRTCYESSCEATVQYLHRTVKDFLEEPETWEWIVSANQEPFDPNIRWCESYLAQVKGQDPECLTTAMLMGKVTWCMSYASQITNSSDQIRLMDELDRAATALTLAPRRDGRALLSQLDHEVDEYDEYDETGDSHWVSLFIEWIPDASFTYLVAMCGMDGYLSYRLQYLHSSIRERSDNDSTPFLLAATEDFVALHRFTGRRGIVRVIPHLPTIEVILKAGESPFRDFRGRSMWMLAEAIAEREAGYEEVLDLYHKYGRNAPRGKSGRRQYHEAPAAKTRRKDGLQLSAHHLSMIPDTSRPRDLGTYAEYSGSDSRDESPERRRRPRYRDRRREKCVVL